MSLIRQLKAGLRGLVRKHEVEQELDDELRHFLAESIAAKRQAGMSEAEAERTARAEMGSVSAAKEEVRGGGWEAFVETIWSDVRYGARSLHRNPGFAAIAILTLALGIGANSAVFSVVNGLILRPLPYAEPQNVILIWTDDVKRGLHEGATGIPTIDDWRSDSRHLSDVAVYRGNRVTVKGEGDPERVASSYAAANLFPLLGARPAAGRLFTADEDKRGDPVVVISYALWQRRFGGADVLGRSMTLDGDMTAWKKDPRSLRIIGVMKQDFYFPSKDVQLWEPLGAYWRYGEEAADRFSYNAFNAVGRLQPGVSVADAQRGLGEIAGRLERAFPTPPKDFPGFRANVVPVLDTVTGRDLRFSLWILLGAVGLVLLIACVNVANLLLARSSARQREFAIRLALGAGRGRVLRQLLVESALLAGLGGALGLALAAALVRVVIAAAPAGLPRVDELAVDSQVTLFTLLLSMLSAAVFGLAPAWGAATKSPQDSLRAGGDGASAARRTVRVRGALVMTECALAVVLLIGAGLLMRSFAHVRSISPGFDPKNVLVLRLAQPQPAGNLRAEQVFAQREAEIDRTLTSIRNVPGVVDVGASGELMMTGDPDEDITFEGESFDLAKNRGIKLNSGSVTPGYFHALRVPLRTGRLLTRDDAFTKLRLLFTGQSVSRSSTAEPTMVNEAFVKQFLRGKTPIGVRFWDGNVVKPYWYEIVGVIGDMHRQGLEREGVPEFFGSAIGGGVDIVVRTAGDPVALAPAVRGAVRAENPQTLILRMTTAEEQLGAFSDLRRFQAWLLAAFALLALCLAATGIYGVMRYTVEQRAQEIGVRLALGASAGDVLRLVVGRGVALSLGGALIGAAGALALSRLLTHLLYGVSAEDPLTFAGVVTLLAGVSVVACYLPARRAARIDPLQSLRHD